MRRILLAFVFSVAALFGAAASAQSDDGFGADADFVDGAAKGVMEALSVPGIGLAVVDLERGTLLRTYGYADEAGTPLDVAGRGQLLPIASISKTFSAVALMKAVEQGKVDLDRPVNEYLDFKLPRFRDSRDITLRDLAHHEAGFEERWLATGSGYERDTRPWGEILASTYPQLIAPPGEYASYSNYGAALIAYVVERATGVPFDRYLDEQVLAPLGMTSTTVRDPLPEGFAGGVTPGVRSRGGVWQGAGPKTHNPRTYPAGRVVTTLPDMARYMTMLLDNGRAADGSQFLKPESVRTLLTATERSHPGMPGMAMIFAEKDIAGQRVIGHGGDGGTHHTDMALLPDKGIGVLVVFLSAPGPQARDYLLRTILPRLTGEAAPGIRKVGDAVDLSEYAGRYRHYRWAFSSIERLLQLSSEFGIADSGSGTLVVEGRLSPGEYVPVDLAEGLFQNRVTGEYLHFSESFDGRLNVNMGSFPFVTAYRLDGAETQSGAGLRFAFLTLLSLVLTVIAVTMAVRAMRRSEGRRAIGNALLAIAALAIPVAAIWFLMMAASLGEPQLTQAIPAAATPLLAVPFAAFALAAIWAVGAIAGLWRPLRTSGWIVAGSIIVTLVGWAVFLDSWNALGWNYPSI